VFDAIDFLSAPLDKLKMKNPLTMAQSQNAFKPKVERQTLKSS
jgi:hypothetical protein